MAKYSYLNDKNFLKKLDLERVTTTYAKIIVLNWNEDPIEEITGKVLPGNVLNLNANSAIRATANLSIFLDDEETNVTNIDNILSINKKVSIEIGVSNNTGYYTKEKIIWFPKGVFVVMGLSINHSVSNVTVQLELRDKMVLLNGEVGGSLPASVTFSEMEYTDEKGQVQISKPTIFQIIFELVNHFGGEQLGKIIIEGVDTRIKKVVKWNNPNRPVYLYFNPNNSDNKPEGQKEITINYDDVLTNQSGLTEEEKFVKILSYGHDIGYVYSDFYWPNNDLIGDAGASICSVLDQIKDLLGNYEYFYDVDGNFHFQEIKNYLNTSHAYYELDKITKNDYMIDQMFGKSEYQLDDGYTVTSYANKPLFNQIKNDFIVWGMRKSVDGSTYPIRFHLAIDDKPELNAHTVYIYTDKEDGLIKAMGAYQVNSIEELNELENPQPDTIYYLLEPSLVKTYENSEFTYTYSYEDNNFRTRVITQEAGRVFKWNFSKQKCVEVDFTDEECMFERGEIFTLTSLDWRTELYLQGAEAVTNGTDPGFYYAELKAEWPKIYNILEGRFYEEALTNPSGLDWFLDFIDTTSPIGNYNVNNIGRRSLVLVEDKINCVFAEYPEDLILIEAADSNDADAIKIQQQLIKEAMLNGVDFYQVSTEIYKNLVQGGNYFSAFDKIRELLYLHMTYLENITVQCIPIYHLDVNTRITVKDKKSNISGDYLINSITLPISNDGLMTINASRVLERDGGYYKGDELNMADVLDSGSFSGLEEYDEYIKDYINKKIAYLESLGQYTLPIASESTLGGVKIDNTTIQINSSGVISSQVNIPVATPTQLGKVKPDGITIEIGPDGTISLASNLPSNETSINALFNS